MGFGNALALLASALISAGGAAERAPAHAARLMSAAPVSPRIAHEPLRFGVYPGGPLGSVSPTERARPVSVRSQLRALRALRDRRPFVVHVFYPYRGGGAARARAPGLRRTITRYTRAGLRVELVSRYRVARAGADPAAAVAGYVDYVRAIVDRYGSNRRFVALQITNEANLSGQLEASDGGYAGARDALVQGVITASGEARRTGARQLEVGFNWAFDGNETAARGFWSDIGARGGPAFAAAVDWVGINCYPGTWDPELPVDGRLPRRAAGALVGAVRALRSELMPLAGLDAEIPIHVSENGWPTGPGRPQSVQAAVLRRMVHAVSDARGELNISDYRWFDLRDSNSSDRSMESHYGLLTDDYGRKPAFNAYRRLIADLGRPRRDRAAHRQSDRRVTSRARRSRARRAR